MILDMIRTSTAMLVMVLAIMVQPTQAQIGTTVCICSPSSYEITFDFSKNCADTNLQPSQGIEDSACRIEPINNPGVTDLVPVTVNTVDVFELDESLQVISQIVIEGPFVNGDSDFFSSISSDPSQVSAAAHPRGLQIVARGTNAEEVALQFTMLILYRTDCETFSILSEGSTIGWITFTDLQDPLSAVCPAASPSPTASPTMMPTDYPSGSPTQTPSTSPKDPTDFPSGSPTQTPSTSPKEPMDFPSGSPTQTPSTSPKEPTDFPSGSPTQTPSTSPKEPTDFPSGSPTQTPSTSPKEPTDFPSASPTQAPRASPTASPTESPDDDSPSSKTPFLCFSGETTVEVQGQGATRMDQLKIGDMVRSGSGSFTTVYSFGHYAPSVESHFLQIETDTHKAPLELTCDHMVFVLKAAVGANGRNETKIVPVPARDIRIGDHLVSNTNHLSPEGIAALQPRVTAIRKVQRRGAYAPFTRTGDLVVNGVVASNYIALPCTFQRAGLTFEHQHWFQHVVHAPYRLHCRLAEDGCEHEAYDEETGFSKAVLFWLPALKWMEGQDPDILLFFLATVTLTVSCVLFGLINFLVDNVGRLIWMISSLLVKAALTSFLVNFLIFDEKEWYFL